MHDDGKDDSCDIPISPTNMNQYIVWATGGLGETAFIHFNRADRKFFDKVLWPRKLL